MSLSKVRAFAVAGWATFCVILSHYAGYFLAFDDPHARAHALEGSGHSWYSMAAPALLLGAVLGGVSTWVDARRSRSSSPSRSGSARVLYLAALSGLLFVEFSERLVHLGSLAEVLHNLSTPASFVPILLAAVLLLLVVVPFVWAVEHAIRRAASRPSVAARQVVVAVFTDVSFRSLWRSLSCAPRGPPFGVQGSRRRLLV